jgi:hypothetical protein
MKKIHVLLFLFLPFLGISQTNTIKTGQAILVDVYNSNDTSYIVLDFIIINNGEVINNNLKLRTFQLNEGVNIGGWISTKKDINDFILNKKEYICKGCIVDYEIKNNNICSVFFSLLFDTDK